MDNKQLQGLFTNEMTEYMKNLVTQQNTKKSKGFKGAMKSKTQKSYIYGMVKTANSMADKTGKKQSQEASVPDVKSIADFISGTLMT